jgi:oligoribonuclease (3'-5' exoribonuclease)
MSTSFTESIVEDASLAWLESFGYAVLHAPDDTLMQMDDECTREIG